MILVTRLTGAAFAVNPDLLERVEATPDTVLTLIDGTKYLVAESVVEVIDLVRDYRASVVASARSLREPVPAALSAPEPCSEARGDLRPDLHVVPALRVVSREAAPEEV
ncbi:flagellar FlbD family protein [Quadrisphaera oryzae]|uniref:flagellar FlbD family protein n=1 Tax=Quadrisphaera TaxID=317661 RepID=UPI00164637F7|nr:flagellar FlbD family protein [Quadrisphaera sp. RL12-1S]MBC3763758.1 flagellar FlbD family protein [Quadrisphaera sp. RL12-1S]